MATHTFDVELAIEYGAESSAILTNIEFWLIKNKANNKHFYDGRYWTYNSIKAFNELFPYMSEGQIRRRIDFLREKKVLIKGNFNKLKLDKTSWYSLDFDIIKSIRRKHHIDLMNPSNANDAAINPIPDSKLTDVKTDINNKDSKPELETRDSDPKVSFGVKADFFIKIFNETKGTAEKPRGYKMNKKLSESLDQRLKEGYSSKDFIKAIINCKKDEYHIETRLKHLTPEFILRADKLEKFLNANDQIVQDSTKLSNAEKRKQGILPQLK